MPDCFISYSKHDEELAQFVASELRRHDVSVFMASASLEPGERWTEETLSNLRSSGWVIVLASRVGCRSAYVNQEVGGALLACKRIVPVVWDMSPDELPGWLGCQQALDLRRETLDSLHSRIAAIADRIKQDKAKGVLIVAAMIFGLLILGSKR